MKFLKNIFNTGITFIKVILKSKRYIKPVFPTNKKVFVLGNGPALKEFLAKEPTFFDDSHLVVVNSFASTEYYEKLKPESYFIKDGLWFWITEEEYNNPHSTWRESKSSGESNSVIAVAGAIRAIVEKTSWNLHLYIPFFAKNSVFAKLVGANPNIKLVYFNNVKASGFDSVLYPLLYKRGLANPQFPNVVCMALLQKINEGFKEIYLSGVNANFHQYLHVGDDNKVYTLQHHFYDKEPTKNLVSDRDSNGNYTPQQIWQQFRILMILMQSFQEIEKYARYNSVKIYNTSRESFIDAFERKYVFETIENKLTDTD